MPDRAIFLRGLNLGGRRLTNDELVARVRALGLSEVRAILASGNLVVRGGDASEAELRERLESGLAAALGYEVATFVRTAQELRSLANGFPFGDAEIAGAGKPQLVFLSAEPTRRAREEVRSAVDEADRFVFGPRALYWLPAGRLTDSTTDWRRIEKALGATTTRTWNTIRKVLARLD